MMLDGEPIEEQLKAVVAADPWGDTGGITQRRAWQPVRGEQALCRAVLIDALVAGLRGDVPARQWIMGRPVPYPRFDFATCCGAVGLAPDAIRRSFWRRLTRPGPVPTPHMLQYGRAG